MKKDDNSVKPNNNTNNSKIYSKEKFFKEELGIENPEDLKNDKVQIRAIKELKKIDLEKLRKYFEVNPMLAATLIDLVKSLSSATLPDVVKAFSSAITDIKDVQKVRYETLKDVVNSGELNGDQIITALKIIQEIEGEEGKRIIIIIKEIGKIALRISIVAGFVVAASLGIKQIGKDSEESL